jgi:hypothetical protein
MGREGHQVSEDVRNSYDNLHVIAFIGASTLVNIGTLHKN